MTKYTVYTKQSIERTYTHELELPIDMGESNDKLCDRMIRTAAENGSLALTVQMDLISDSANEGEQEVTFIYRGDKQIWPAHRKRNVKGTKSFGKSSSKTPAPDPEDGAFEDSVSSDT